MTSPISLPEMFKIVNVAPIQAANAVTYDAICCKTAHKVWFIIIQDYAADTDLTCSLSEGTDVAMGTTAAVTAALPVWYNADVAAATTGAAATTMIDGLTKITSGSSHEFDTSAGKAQMCIIEWDPAKHTAGYDCIALTDANGNASNEVAAIAIVQTRYPGPNPPSVVID